MIVRKNDRVVVIGITGKQGTFWTEKMIAYGTNVVAGVNPKRAGETHVGVPIFGTPAEAAQKIGVDVAVMFVPPVYVFASVRIVVPVPICETEPAPEITPP